MTRVAAAVALVLALFACEGRRDDPVALFASAACSSLQTWIDAVEDETVQLSRAVTPLEDSAERAEQHRLFARAVDLRTWDLLRQLRRVAPSVGAGKDAAGVLLAAVERSRDVTQELIVLADSFPEGDDPEPLMSRISSLFVRLEKAFVHPNRARDELALRYDAFADAPACVDYADPVS